MDEARDYELSLPNTCTFNGAQVDSSAPHENRVLTFAELKELIESGNVDKIPNNKIISEKLNVWVIFKTCARGIFLTCLLRMRLQVNRRLLQK